jgi:dTDP-4-dehydrorhamnose 3,5-epimerase
MKSEITGVYFRPLDFSEDLRGWLTELWRSDELLPEHKPEMGYVSMSHPGTTRGPHEHLNQTDCFVFMGAGDFELYLWDKFGVREIYLVGKSNPCVAIIPPGIVHAYKNVSDEPGIVLNFPNQLYAGPGKKYKVDEIRYENHKTCHYRMDN